MVELDTFGAIGTMTMYYTNIYTCTISDRIHSKNSLIRSFILRKVTLRTYSRANYSTISTIPASSYPNSEKHISGRIWVYTI